MAECAQILLVEDEGIVALDLKNRLLRLGYIVVAIAPTGEEAILKTAEMQPDLILMDIRLRGELDGIQAAQIIRDRFHVPVIYLTAMADKDTLQRAEATQPSGLIMKPFADGELRTTIEAALGPRQTSSKESEQQ